MRNILQAGFRVFLLAASALAAAPALAEDRIAMAIGQRGNWDTAIVPLGQQKGIFKKHGIAIDVLWTQGAGESQQAVLARSADLGLAGTLGAFALYAKGAPVRIVAAEATGAADFWYVRADSPVRSMKDTGGRTVAFSTTGASTHIMAMGFLKQAGVANARLTATGGPPGTLTQVMSGQIDVGWSAPPFGLKQLAAKEIRIVAYGKELDAIRGQSVRVWITPTDRLATRRPAIERLIAAYKETIDWMYAGDEALPLYGEFAGISPEMAREVRDVFFPRAMLQPDRILGIDAQMQDAVAHKYLQTSLTQQQLGELIQIATPVK